RTETTRGQTYVADYVELDPDANQMRERQALLPPAMMGRYLALPDDTPPQIAAVARSRTAGLTNDYDRVVALQDWMREDFRYSETSPVAEGYDGNGVEVIERFLVEEQA
ncbi:transglutaminase domain-containing protein, partial [Aeromicrobium phragmitis]